MTPLTLTQSLTKLVRSAKVTDEHLVSASRYVRDWLGAAAAGGATTPGRILRSYAEGRPSEEDRVFLAAALSHITETDDLHRASTTHPACVVIPTALIFAGTFGASGRAALRAVLAGYEVMLRVGEALGSEHYRTFHNTATAGVFGAAAAAATILELDERQWGWALGNAGTQAGGLWQFNEDATMSKHLHAGHAAQAGARSALLARAGFTGPAAILEGARGFFAGFCPNADPSRVLAPGNDWKLTETSLKPYPSCRHTHPAIDAALAARTELGPPEPMAGEVERVTVSSYPAALALTDNPNPFSPYAARFSMQFCVGTALLHGRVGMRSFDDDGLADEALRRLLTKTNVQVDETLARAYPREWGAAVEVCTSGGRCVRIDRSTARGDPEVPLMDEEIDAKTHELCAYGGIEPATTDRLLEACRNLPNGGPPVPIPWTSGDGGALPSRFS